MKKYKNPKTYDEMMAKLKDVLGRAIEKENKQVVMTIDFAISTAELTKKLVEKELNDPAAKT